MNQRAVTNKILFKQLLILVIGVAITLPLFFSANGGDIFTLRNGLRGDKFNYLLIALLGIVLVISATRELWKIAKKKTANT